MKLKDPFVHPEDSTSVLYWTRKWGVTPRQLSDAILHTGSVNTVDLKEYLKKEIWYYAPLFGFLKMLRIKV